MSKYSQIIFQFLKRRSIVSFASIATLGSAYSYKIYQHQFQQPLFLCDGKLPSVLELLESDSYENLSSDRLESSMIYLNRGDPEQLEKVLELKDKLSRIGINLHIIDMQS